MQRRRSCGSDSACTALSSASSKTAHGERNTVSLRRFIGAGLAAAAVLLPSEAPSDAVAQRGTAYHGESRTLRAGELLVATPRMRDPRFRKTVILLVRHDDSGTFGLVVNRVLGKLKLSAALERLGLKVPGGAGEIVLHYGGPVRPQVGFVVHSTEQKIKPAYRVNDKVAVSLLDKFLRAISVGKRPRQTVFAVGYAGWAPGQLEGEMRRGDWFTAPADEDILFDDRQDTKWARALRRRFRSL